MAIARDSTVGYNSGGTTGITHTYAFNNVAGDGMVVCVQFPNNLTVNSITYNGTTMTQGVAVVTSSYWKSQIWYLASPTTGSNNVVVTFNSATNAYLISQATSFSGSNTSALTSATGTNAYSGASPVTCSITTNFNNSIIVDSVLVNHNSGGITKDASQTLNATAYNSTWTYNGGSSYYQQVTAGSKTMQWTYASSDDAPICAIEIREAAAAGPTNVKTWDGLSLASVKTINGLAIASVKTVNGLN